METDTPPTHGQACLPIPILRGPRGLTWGELGSGVAGPWRVDLSLGARLADHVIGHQVAVEDVPCGRDEAAAVADTCRDVMVSGPWVGAGPTDAPPTPVLAPPTGQCVRVHLQVPLTVGLGGEGGQADETHEGALAWNRGSSEGRPRTAVQGECRGSPWLPGSQQGPSPEPNIQVGAGRVRALERGGRATWAPPGLGCSPGAGAVRARGLGRGVGLTAVAAHVDLQGAGTGAAFAALGEGAHALVGVGLLGLLVGGGRGWGGSTLAAGAVVEEVGLQVPLAAVPDPAVLAGEDVFCGGKKWVLPEGRPQPGCGLGPGCPQHPLGEARLATVSRVPSQAHVPSLWFSRMHGGHADGGLSSPRAAFRRHARDAVASWGAHRRSVGTSGCPRE